MKKILVTGGRGQLGSALADVLSGEEVLLTDTDNMEITDLAQIERTFADFKPDFLVHGAAITNVDGCEENAELAEEVNAQGSRNLAEACKKAAIPMIYISTDYVFDGTATEPIKEDTIPNPLSVYGRTKLEGEEATLSLPNGYVLRTSWVYGEGKNFVRTMLALSEKMDEIKIVSDQIGRPTYALDLAKAIYNIIQKTPGAGIYNITGDGEIVSWADFARKIFQVAGKSTKVIDITTEEYLSDKQDRKIAPRPKYSALDLNKSKVTNLHLESWEKALVEYLRA
jgi:dTDP-4-dehydrorhamnose reductase